MDNSFIGIILSAMATGLGAVPILFLDKINGKMKCILLGFASGVMMAATAFSLIPEALKASNLLVLSIGMLAGTIILNYVNSKVSELDAGDIRFNPGIDRKTLIIVIAIMLHNLPEGLSVGVSYGSGEDNLGTIIALAIGLQNAPEGFLVAIYLHSENISRIKSLLIAALTGAVEIVTGTIGYFLASKVDGLVPYGLSFAAGAMLFVIFKELIPDSNERKEEKIPTYAFVLGLLAMLFLVQEFG
ncbi:ZIP family metal transporter [Bacillus sp. AG4(2022)]|uniref:ZIP family metal transporter n=1 Tax=Bacillus sp. AG4(2022) TaxID=2962594 RepID=UPI002880E437|nr:ZIP family metal transporter [Bacillus sp. AG4(2022)]MDT0160949.1 ZIP family metal transporter [Bacillus sp. AG4(2022)]